MCQAPRRLIPPLCSSRFCRIARRLLRACALGTEMETPPADVTIVKGMGAVFPMARCADARRPAVRSKRTHNLPGKTVHIFKTIIFTGRARGVYDDNTKRSA